MFFNTIEFYAIFVAFLLFFALLRKTTRTGMMLYVVAFSMYFFYAANHWLCVLLPMTAILSYAGTTQMAKSEGKSRKRWIWLLVILDLAPLLYFKYADFSIGLINDLFNQNFPLKGLIVPMGISFYTFQAISHAVDVYKRKFTTPVTLLEYCFYLTFFPLLLAGPITRAEHFFPQIKERKPVDMNLLYTGLWLIIIGLVKKSIIADYVAQYNNWIFEDPMGYSGFENFMGVIGYTVQIYCDFSGYSDMSIGIAALMGIRLKDNFNFPYQSLNVSEFWRRWHISLSTWFRDYLYIPLGGNRKGKLKTYFNNFLTMVVAGAWHGSTAMFMLWGAMHGAALVVHKYCKQLFLDKLPNKWYVTVLCWILFQLFLINTWLFFRAPDLETAGSIYSRVFTDFDMAYLPYFIKARPMWLGLVVGAYLLHAIRERHFLKLQDWFVKSPIIVKVIVLVVVVQLAIEFHSNSVQPFIYAQF